MIKIITFGLYMTLFTMLANLAKAQPNLSYNPSSQTISNFCTNTQTALPTILPPTNAPGASSVTSGIYSQLAVSGSNFLSKPISIVTDANNNVYVLDAKGIEKYNGTSWSNIVPYSNLDGPIGMTIDENGNLYVSNYGTISPSISKVANTSWNVTTLFTLPSSQRFNRYSGSIAYNIQTDELYYFDASHFQIDKIKATASSPSSSVLVGSGQHGLTDGSSSQTTTFEDVTAMTMHYDAGNPYIYLSDDINAPNFNQTTSSIRKIQLSIQSSASTFFGIKTIYKNTHDGQLCGIAVDALGQNIYMSSLDNSTIASYNINTSTYNVIGGETGSGVSKSGTSGYTTHFNSPFGLTLDKNGYLWIADNGNSDLVKMNLFGWGLAFIPPGGPSNLATTIDANGNIIFPLPSLFPTATTTYQMAVTNYTTAGQSTANYSITLAVVLPPAITIVAKTGITTTAVTGPNSGNYTAHGCGSADLTAASANSAIKANNWLWASSSGGVTYQSTNASNSFIAITNDPVTYTVTGYFQHCSSTTNVTVTIDQTPTAPTVNVTLPTCFSANGSVAITSTTSDLTFSNGSSYAAYSAPFSVAGGAGYSITAKNSSGCVSPAVIGAMSAQPPTPTAPTVKITSPTCTSATGTIAVTSTTTSLTFSNNGSLYASYSVPFSVLAGAAYSITAKNSSGCVSPAVNGTMSAQPKLPTITTQPSISGQSVCKDNTLTALSIIVSGTGLSYQWYSNTTNSNSGGTAVTTGIGDKTASYTPSSSKVGVNYYYCVVSGACGSPVTSAVSGLITVGIPITAQPSTTPQTVCIGGTLTALSVAATGTNLTYKWYSNTNNSNSGGILISGATSASYTPLTSATIANYYYCIVSNGTCSAATSTVSGKITVNAAPLITTQPSTSVQTICVGGTLTALSVTVTGTNLTYQWYSNATNSNSGGILISGATSASYTPSTSTASAYYYYCLVGNGTCSAATSAVSGLITVKAAPSITVSPSTSVQTVCVGGTLTALSVTVTGTNLTYQWYSNATNSNSGGILISGATSASYTPSTSTTSAYYYYCLVGNGTCSAATSTVSGLITVKAAPSITASPSTSVQTVCVGGTLTPLTVTASGAGLSYQWYSNATNSNSGGILISGATSAFYTPSTSTASAYYYYCIVSNGTCSAATNTVSGLITVKAAPSITASPSTSVQTVCVGGTLTPLTVTASGAGLSYQWYSNTTNSNSRGILISGATSASFTPSTSTAYANYYYCVVSGTCGSTVTSAVSGLITVGIPISAQPSTTPQTVCIGGTLTALSVTVTGTNLTYQWYSNTTNSNSGGILISGATSASYTPSTSTASAYYYYCLVGNGTCSATSAVSGLITVNASPTVNAITGVPTSGIICTGLQVQLADATSGGKWSCIPTSLATVNSAGVLTGVTAGTATIGYSVTSNTAPYCIGYATPIIITVQKNQSTNLNRTISGPATVCSSGSYTLTPGLQTGETILWSLSSGNSGDLQISNFTSNPITVINKNWYTYTTNLSAVVNLGNCVTASIPSIPIEAASFNNTYPIYNYTVPDCYAYNQHHNIITGTVSTNSTPPFIFQGCPVDVSLGKILASKVSFQDAGNSSGGMMPIWTAWNDVTGNCTLHFELPAGSGGVPFTWVVQDNSPCFNPSNLLFFSQSGSSSYSIKSSVRISESIPNKEKIITAFPNPVKNIITISGSHIANVQMIDNFGRVVKVQSFIDAVNPSIIVNTLASGIYHLRIQTTDGKASSTNIIKE